MSGKLFAAKHSWTTLRMSKLLFVGSYCRSGGELSANEKKERFASNDESPATLCDSDIATGTLAGA